MVPTAVDASDAKVWASQLWFKHSKKVWKYIPAAHKCKFMLLRSTVWKWRNPNNSFTASIRLEAVRTCSQTPIYRFFIRNRSCRHVCDTCRFLSLPQEGVNDGVSGNCAQWVSTQSHQRVRMLDVAQPCLKQQKSSSFSMGTDSVQVNLIAELYFQKVTNSFVFIYFEFFAGIRHQLQSESEAPSMMWIISCCKWKSILTVCSQTKKIMVQVALHAWPFSFH